MVAQFLSALADNAMLLLCIALLVEQGQAAWWIPLLKVFFTLSYVFLAPWVGLIADRWPKPQVMRWANLIKLLGCIGLLLGTSVPLAYALIGLGAALYAPAKYGWITEVVPASALVRANGWIEVGTVGAAIFGVSLGGFMLSPWVMQSAAVEWVQNLGGFDTGYAASLLAMVLLYLGPVVLTHWVTPSEVDYPHQSLQWRSSLMVFVQDQQLLWCDAQARVSLAVTTLFWGLGAVMQLLILQWAQEQLGVSIDQGAYLQGCTGIGVIAGAWMAGRFIPLHQAMRVLGLGILLGLAMPSLCWIDTIAGAVTMMLVVGFVSGVFVVPMNALLQHRGVQLLTAGRSIAVQNFNENASILLQMGLYSALVFSGVSLNILLFTLGAMVAFAMGAVMLHHRALQTQLASSQGRRWV